LFTPLSPLWQTTDRPWGACRAAALGVRPVLARVRGSAGDGPARPPWEAFQDISDDQDAVFCKALEAGDLDMVRVLLQAGTKPEPRAVHAAITAGRLDAAGVVLQQQLQENEQPPPWVLHTAVMMGDLDSVRRCLQVGWASSHHPLAPALVAQLECSLCHLSAAQPPQACTGCIFFAGGERRRRQMGWCVCLPGQQGGLLFL
jgi:hypothetical protein